MNRSWALARYPRGLPQAGDFELVEDPLAEPSAGELLVRNTLISVDPGVRSRMSGDSYGPQMKIGDVIDGFAVGVVEASRNDRFSVGDRVSGGKGWRQRYLSDGKGLLKLDPKVFTPPITEGAALGVLGVSGLTAYFAVTRVAAAVPGEIVLVSSAAGAVGSAAVQIGRLTGCRVFGIAGGPSKCAYVVGTLGAEDCLDYRSVPDVESGLRAMISEGVDVYIDTVGGEVLDAALRAMGRGGRIAVVGQTSEYNRPQPRGIRHVEQLVSRSLTMQGFEVWDFLPDFKPAVAEMAEWVKRGELEQREETWEGFDQLPAAFIGLLRGDNQGRRLVRL